MKQTTSKRIKNVLWKKFLITELTQFKTEKQKGAC